MSNALNFGNKVVFIGGLPITLPTAASDPGSASNGDMYYNTTIGAPKYYNGSWNTFGSVTSVGLVEDPEGGSQTMFTISGSPVIGTGTLHLSLASQPTGNLVMATPDGMSGQPYFRSLVSADIPSLNYAAQDLSNLTSPTAINQHLLPFPDVTYDLGSASQMWNNLYVQNAYASALTVGYITTAFSPILMLTDMSMQTNKITNLAAGSSPTDAVNYSQLTSLVTGLVWQNPVQDPDLVEDSLSTPPGSPVISLLYIIAASPTGAWTGLAGHAVWWDGFNWIDLSTGNIATSGQGAAVLSGARFLVAADTDVTYTFTVTAANATATAVYTNNGYFFTVQSTITGGTTLVTTSNGIPSGGSGTLTLFSGSGDSTISFTSYTNEVGGGLVGHNHQIAVVDSNTPGSFTYTFTSPFNNWATSDITPGSNHYGNSYTYSTDLTSWVNFSGPAKTSAGSALSYSGNTLNVRYDNTTITLNGSNQLQVGTIPYANQALSNLTSPTAVNQHLLPDATNTRDLGSSTKEWRDLYIAGKVAVGTTSVSGGRIVEVVYNASGGGANISVTKSAINGGAGVYSGILVGQVAGSGNAMFMTMGGGDSGNAHWYHQNDGTISCDSKLHLRSNQLDTGGITLSSGNVGINNTSPSTALYVSGKTTIADPTDEVGLIVLAGGTGVGSGINLDASAAGGARNYQILSTGSGNGGASGPSAMAFVDVTASNAYRYWIDSSGRTYTPGVARFGSSTTPVYPVDVTNGSTIGIRIQANTAGAGATFDLDASGLTGGRDYVVVSTDNGNGDISGGKWAVRDTAASGAASYRLVINSSGFVGIQASSPTAGLHVGTNGAASQSGILNSGTWFTGGSATTTKPQSLIEPTGTASTNWSTSGTGLGINAASGFAGNLIHAQVAAVDKFIVDASGQTRIGTNTVVSGAVEQVSVLNNLTSAPGGITYALTGQMKLDFDGASANAIRGVNGEVYRKILNNQTDTSSIGGLRAQAIVDVPTTKTYTNSNTSGIFGLNIAALSILSGGSVASNAYGILVTLDTTAVTGIKTGMRIQTPTNGTTGNAAIADNAGFSGNWFIYQNATDSSILGGSLKLGTSSTNVELTTLTSFTIVDNTASPTDVFSLASASYSILIVDYTVSKATFMDGGTIYITNDTTNVAYANVGSSTGATGVALTATLSGGNIKLQYTATNTGANGTMKYSIRRW